MGETVDSPPIPFPTSTNLFFTEIRKAAQVRCKGDVNHEKRQCPEGPVSEGIVPAYEDKNGKCSWSDKNTRFDSRRRRPKQMRFS